MGLNKYLTLRNAQIVFYILAGLNHFRNPDFYMDLIPPYMAWHVSINITVGLIEVCFGVMSIFSRYLRVASAGIIVMLTAFIPAHVYFIQIGSCIEGGLCVPEWIGWARLLVIHPILMLWAYWVGFRRA